MRVELIDPMGTVRGITSTNLDLIGRWFADQAPRHMSADCRMVSRIQIWPDTHEEFGVLNGQNYSRTEWTQDGLLQIAQAFLDAATKQGELESAR